MEGRPDRTMEEGEFLMPPDPKHALCLPLTLVLLGGCATGTGGFEDPAAVENPFINGLPPWDYLCATWVVLEIGGGGVVQGGWG